MLQWCEWPCFCSQTCAVAGADLGASVTAAAGIKLEKTSIGKALSGAVMSMLITSILVRCAPSCMDDKSIIQRLRATCDLVPKTSLALGFWFFPLSFEIVALIYRHGSCQHRPPSHLSLAFLSPRQANIGLLPSGSIPYISSSQSFVVHLATPLLLLGADLRLIVESTGVMMRVFLVGR